MSLLGIFVNLLQPLKLRKVEATNQRNNSYPRRCVTTTVTSNLSDVSQNSVLQYIGMPLVQNSFTSQSAMIYFSTIVLRDKEIPCEANPTKIMRFLISIQFKPMIHRSKRISVYFFNI